MAKTKLRRTEPAPRLLKAATGIGGFDEITSGGLPVGRPTLVCGSAGCGKSLFATEFLVRGAMQFGEPGVLMTFEESAEDIKKNVSSLGFDLNRLIAQKKVLIDHVVIDRSQIEENGEYDLEGLFIRLDFAIKAIKAKRVVLDTIETLFSGLTNQALLRNEIRRLFVWLKDRGMTTVITGERGEGTLTRQGLEEYVSDCVILLDHRVLGQVSTRRLRIVKYRGSTHGTNEYPFLIDEHGISVMPLTTAGMDYSVSNERVSSGVSGLDEMLGGKGLFRGSSVMLSGTAGSGKSSMGIHFADATCRRGERCLYFSFEESPAQIIRNMRSIGIDLEPHVRSGLLEFHATRPTVLGLEMHLVRMQKLIERFKPSAVVVDPVTNLAAAGTLEDSSRMIVRLIDFLRRKHITAYLIALTHGGKFSEATEEGLSSIVDTWLLVRDIELAGERNRAMYVLKSRGMAHSNQVREFLITSDGLKLIPAYLGSGGVLTGSARLSQEAAEERAREAERDARARNQMALAHRRSAIEAQIEAIRAGFKAEEEEYHRVAVAADKQLDLVTSDQARMANSRRVLNGATVKGRS